MSSVSQTRQAEILLVEDEPADVDLVKQALKSSKIKNNLNVVGNGNDAINFLRKEGGFSTAKTPDLILLDLNLPGISGKELLATVKQDSQLKMIPVTIMTSSDSEEDVVKSYEQHANCYVRKPMNLNEFKKIVDTIDHFWFSIVTLPKK